MIYSISNRLIEEAYEDDLTTPAHALTPGAEEEFKEVCTFEWKQLNFIYLLLLLSGGREKRQESGQEPGCLKDERGQAGYVSPSWILCLRSRGEPGRAGYASLECGRVEDSRDWRRLDLRLAQELGTFLLASKCKLWCLSLEKLWIETQFLCAVMCDKRHCDAVLLRCDDHSVTIVTKLPFLYIFYSKIYWFFSLVAENFIIILYCYWIETKPSDSVKKSWRLYKSEFFWVSFDERMVFLP